MPSFVHEALIELFRVEKTLAAVLLGEVPEFDEARTDEAALTELVPASYAADLLVVLLRGGRPVLVIIVEIQLDVDAQKRLTWPVYAATARARWSCPSVVLVVTPRDRVAKWAAKPIHLGGRSVFRVEALGPSGIPRITDPAEAERMPELAVLSALAHGNAAGGATTVLAAFAALAKVDDERARLYYDVVDSALDERTRQEVTQMVLSGKYEYQSEFARRYVAQGREEGLADGRKEGRADGRKEGRAEAVLRVLELRGLEVPQVIRERVLATEDDALLEQYLARALTVGGAEQLFD